MAVAILVASDQLDGDRMPGTALIGELALDGSLRPVPGAMALVAAAKAAGAGQVILPMQNAAEGAAVGGIYVRGAQNLGQVARHVAGSAPLAPTSALSDRSVGRLDDAVDLAWVVGQRVGRRALEIAVAGRHNLAFTGPPGVGKTLLAGAAAGLLPLMDDHEAAEVSRIHSVAGRFEPHLPLGLRRPFRAPHHTISTQALVGGGPRIRPGEASLAHRGALFLDETLQFRADALDALRGPIDAGSVTIARVDGVIALPARFMLLAAFNPCPCGWFAVDGWNCSCEDGTRRRYQGRLSGPMRDRLDMLVSLEPIGTLRHSRRGEPTAAVAERVARAAALQSERQGMPNAQLSVERLDERVGIGATLRSQMDVRGRQMGLSMRRLHRAVRVARTIADLAGDREVGGAHLDEALLHRPKEPRP